MTGARNVVAHSAWQLLLCSFVSFNSESLVSLVDEGKLDTLGWEE